MKKCGICGGNMPFGICKTFGARHLLTSTKTCGLCGHEMYFLRCGSANADGIDLCHADDHSCYVRWTLNKERP